MFILRKRQLHLLRLPPVPGAGRVVGDGASISGGRVTVRLLLVLGGDTVISDRTATCRGQMTVTVDDTFDGAVLCSSTDDS